MDLENKISIETAKILIDLKCINFSPYKQFKLTSGKKSPVYCDCRRLISFPRQREKLINLSIQKIKASKNFCNINNVAGGESAGIPFAALIASKLKLPMSYIRKEKKKFGKNSQIEGLVLKKDNVVLVEDLMTDGGSKIRFLDAIKESKAVTKIIFVIFNYGINKKKFSYKKEKIDLISLTDWSTVIQIGIKKNLLKPKDVEIIKKFLTSIGVKS